MFLFVLHITIVCYFAYIQIIFDKNVVALKLIFNKMQDNRISATFHLVINTKCNLCLIFFDFKNKVSHRTRKSLL